MFYMRLVYILLIVRKKDSTPHCKASPSEQICRNQIFVGRLRIYKFSVFLYHSIKLKGRLFIT